MTVDEQNRVRRFDEKPAIPNPLINKPDKCLASMGNYIFNTEFLFEQLAIDAINKGSCRDFGLDIIPSIIENNNVFAFPFSDPSNESKPYWRDVGTLDSFWEANMDLVTPCPKLDLYDKKWPIWTYQEQLPPAKFVFNDDDRRGTAIDSTVSGGCIISGAIIKNSLLFSNVHAHSYSTVEESVILPSVIIEQNCFIKRAILDRGCSVPSGLTIGLDPNQDIANGFRVSKNGIVLVTPDMLIALEKKSIAEHNAIKAMA